MITVPVKAKRDFLSSLASKRPVQALSELIWNGFDALGSHVDVFIEFNSLDTMEEICVRDNGHGIYHNDIPLLFGNLGESWKKNAVSHTGRALHGKSGKGRFRAFGLGAIVKWKTVYEKDGKRFRCTITGRRDSLDNFSVSDPVEVDIGVETGTEVCIQNLDHHFSSLVDKNSTLEFAKEFAFYLTDYPEVSLNYRGEAINPKSVQVDRQEYAMGEVELADGSKVPVSVSVIEWSVPTERKAYLCDSNGMILHETKAQKRVRAPGFHFTSYIKTDYFRQLDDNNRLELDELSPDIESILELARNEVKRHFRLKIIKGKSSTIDRWKEEKIYPYEGDAKDEIEDTERQMFDVLAVNVESYLPSFEAADNASRKFTFLLLAQAVKDNPGSVQKIITEVLTLNKEDQDELAELLEHASLTSIIKSAQTVANRLNFLNGLERLLFDPESKKRLLERDQLHKILDSEAWLFNEGFALSASEQRLEEVLEKHIGKLGERTEPVELPDGKTGRIDVMLSKVNKPRPGEYDYLIVELKRPSKKVDADVITQIKKYAMAVAEDERFRGIPAKWHFIAVSNEMDSFAKKEANQRDRAPGCVYDDADQNITVSVYEWAEIINNARARLSFINDYLGYESTNDSSRAYLEKVHGKFIPKLEAQSEKE